MNRTLPKYLYAQPHKTGPGVTYRALLPTGEKITLRGPLPEVLRQFYVLMSNPVPVNTASEAVISQMLARHAKGAKQRGIAFSLTAAEASEIVAAQHHRCAITMLPFRNDKPEGLRIRPWAPSLDRIDTRSGYTASNVRIVCAFVNVAMNGFGDSFFQVVLQPLIEAGVQAARHAHIPKSPE